LGWAQTVYGLNSVRIWLPTAMYSTDRDQFYKFFEKFLDIAKSKGMTVMPVVGVGLRDPDALSIQPDPDPNPEWLSGISSTSRKRARWWSISSSGREKLTRRNPFPSVGTGMTCRT